MVQVQFAIHTETRTENEVGTKLVCLREALLKFLINKHHYLSVTSSLLVQATIMSGDADSNHISPDRSESGHSLRPEQS